MLTTLPDTSLEPRDSVPRGVGAFGSPEASPLEKMLVAWSGKVRSPAISKYEVFMCCMRFLATAV